MKTWTIIGMILCGMMVFVFILMIGDLILGKMHEIPKEYCISSGGKWVFYECFNSPIFHCEDEDLKTGYWCEYNDGRKSLNETGIWHIINSTV